MPPSVPATPGTSRSRSALGAVPQPATTRLTRLRAANKDSPVPAPRTPSGLLAKSKEGLRKVSDKMKEREVVRKDTTSESLQAFLRIRPAPAASQSQPYLEPQSCNSVLMRPPADPVRPHIPKPPHVYSFDRVFAPDTTQAAYFTATTLPLVDKLLTGENGLMFAYGVSNSGKSYTIQGGNVGSPEERGVLPRAIDVVFNSIKGLESTANLKCQGLADVVRTFEDTGSLDLPLEPEVSIDEIVKVDRNFSYAVFVSYIEVYNEKIFDLLESILPAPTAKSRASRLGLASSSTFHPMGAFGSSMSLAAMANGGGGVLKRHALVLKNDPEGSGKYIAGLNEVRVRTREEALAVFRSGQRARQVFGTMANRESSRSHGIFTIKVVRIHNGAPDDPESAQVSRLSIVDLAGSERTRNTATTGERLKEAGNINKSLMVLGQCLEVLRANQQKVAAPSIAGIKKKLAVVPFRHSKLTEIFQNFFVGDGRAVMMIHVNPYDTGYDENSHVMRFSAVAREIQTTAHNKVGFPLLKRQISSQFNAIKHAVQPRPNRIKVVVPNEARRERETGGFVMVEEELEVVEEDDDADEDDEQDALVEYLFEQLKEMKTQLYQSELRNASIEVEVREEVAREMQQTIQRMHADFAQRLQDATAAGDLKADEKLDILSRTLAPNDSSFDQSFESARDSSFDTSLIGGRLSDPFVVQVRHVEDVGDPSVDFVGRKATKGKSRRISEVSASTDELAGPYDVTQEIEEVDEDETDDKDVTDDEDEHQRSGDEDNGDEEDEDKEEETDDEEEDTDVVGAKLDNSLDADYDSARSDTSDLVGESDEDDEDDDDDDEDEQDGSDFEAEDESEAESTPPPTPRRLSKKPASPRKTPAKSAAKAAGTPASAKPRAAKGTPATGPRAARVRKSPPASAQKEREKERDGTPLLERLGQDDEENSFEVAPVKPKKKRTLGKKVVLEEEMAGDVGGADIKRLVK
ncbi:hypothetical protein Q5752_004612 [Cryptotrichosporon argae]